MSQKDMKRNIIAVIVVIATLLFLYARSALAHGGMEKACISEHIESLGTGSFQRQAISPRDGKALRGDMSDAKTHYDRGVALAENHQHEKALEEFNKALETSPMSAAIYNGRGITYLRMSRYDLAIGDFTAAIGIYPAGEELYCNRGIAYAMKGDNAKALQDYDRSIELNPLIADSYGNRGSVYAYLACSDWGRSCQLGNCDRLQAAVRAGICVRASEQRTVQDEIDGDR